MKTIKSLFTLLFVSSLLLGSCSSDDTHDIVDDTVILPCDDSPQNLLMLSTPFSNIDQAIIDYNSYGINNLDNSQPNFEGSSITNTNMTYELPTSTSFYNVINNLHGITVTRAGKYFTYNMVSGVGQEFVIPTDITAPVELNNSTYVIEVSNAGYANDSIGDHYEIKSFDIHTGTTGAALAIDPMTKEFDNKNFFHVQSMSSATNGIDELYFVSGTNLITVNTSNNTASHVDLYPSFSNDDYMRFLGLEYSESLGLIAIFDNIKLSPFEHTQNLIQIDASTGSYSTLLSLPSLINSEFYSTTYRECDQTYYLTSLINNNDPTITETIYYEFDLASNTLKNSQVFPDYVFGIELLP